MYLRLGRWVSIQFDLAPVVAGRHQRTIATSIDCVDVSSVRILGPNADRLEGQHTRLRRPDDIAQRRRSRDLATRPGVPWVDANQFVTLILC